MAGGWVYISVADEYGRLVWKISQEALWGTFVGLHTVDVGDPDDD